MNPRKARAILIQAKADDVFEGPIPEDDDIAVTAATSVVKMAAEAMKAGVKGDAVVSILRLSESDVPEEDVPQVTHFEPNNGAGTPVEEIQTATKPWSEIRDKAIAENPGLEQKIEEEREKLDAEITSHDEAAADLAAKLKPEEPWEGYDDEKVTEILADLQIVAEGGVEDHEQVLRDVRTYETAHKGRVRVLRLIEQALGEDEQAQEDPQGAEAPPPEAPDPAPPEADPSGEVGDEEGEGDSPEAGDESGPEGGDAPDDPEPAAPEPSDEDRPGEDAPSSATEDQYRALTTDAELELIEQVRTIPLKVEEENLNIPFDWTTLTDKQVQKFYGLYAALAYRAGFEMLMEEAKARVCKEAADELHAYLLTQSDEDKYKSLTMLEAEIVQDENLKLWRSRARRHDAAAKNHRNERDAYSKIVESLSRLETMRDNEWNRSGNRAGSAKR